MEDRALTLADRTKVLTTEIEQLKEVNFHHAMELQTVHEGTSHAYAALNELVLHITKLRDDFTKVQKMEQLCASYSANAKYELLDPNLVLERYFQPKFYSIEETTFQIISEKKSLAKPLI
ncbi:hypothetical protein LQZ18_04875 [Lachnospiraceae bacterium ZAX-1]